MRRLLILLALLTGCGDIESWESDEQRLRRQVTECIANGGIPILESRGQYTDTFLGCAQARPK